RGGRGRLPGVGPGPVRDRLAVRPRRGAAEPVRPLAPAAYHAPACPAATQAWTRLRSTLPVAFSGRSSTTATRSRTLYAARRPPPAPCTPPGPRRPPRRSSSAVGRGAAPSRRVT